jgi:hypothetical protein
MGQNASLASSSQLVETYARRERDHVTCYRSNIRPTVHFYRLVCSYFYNYDVLRDIMVADIFSKIV